MTLRLFLLTALVAVSSCECTEGAEDRVVTSVGTLTTALRGDGFDVLLESDGDRVRTLQVEVALDNASAVAVAAGGASDIVEAGLSGDGGGPRSILTLVVADSRGVPIPTGVIARFTTDGPPRGVVLSAAKATDGAGAERPLDVR